MTNEQRLAARRAMQTYGVMRRRADADSKSWCEAIEETMQYYDGRDPIRSGLIRMRYIERATAEKTIDALCIGETTYKKAHTDVLSTLAVNAARRGLI